MQHKRSWLSIVSLTAACIICGITACAPSEKSSWGLDFKYNGADGYTVVGLGICADRNLIVPSEHNELPVTTIGKEAFYDSHAVFSVELPDSVTSIEDSAFSGCYYLKELKLSDSLSSIGEEAFYECQTLKTLEIPAGLTIVGEGAFRCCYSLESVIIRQGATMIGDLMFSGCNQLSSVSIPDSVTSIGNRAFVGCQFESIEIPVSVTTIGYDAFFGCKNLKEIIFSGTQEQWNAVEKGDNWDGNGIIDGNGVEVYHHPYTLRFTDGSIDII